jgi:hypothetical protein
LKALARRYRRPVAKTALSWIRCGCGAAATDSGPAICLVTIDVLISKSFQSSGEFRRIGLVSTSVLPNDLVGVGAKQIIRRPLRSQNSRLGLPPRNSPATLAPGFFSRWMFAPSAVNCFPGSADMR